MRTILTIIGLFVIIESSAQTFALYSGVSYGRFYHSRIEGDVFVEHYKPQLGYCVGIEVKDIPLDTLIKIRFAINYQNYGGYFYTTDGGMSGSQKDEGEITKDVLGLEFYPANFIFFDRLQLNVGFSLNVLLNYRMTGTRSYWSIGDPGGGTMDLNTVDGLIKPCYWGLNSSLGYEFQLGKLRIEPRYTFYLGLSKEFGHTPVASNSLRQAVQLSVGYPIR